MKFVFAILALLVTQNVFAAFPTPRPAPIVDKTPTKASLYLVTVTKQADGFFKAVRSPLCTINYTSDIFDLRNIDMPSVQQNKGSCKANINGKEVTMTMYSTIYIVSEKIHNDENELSSKVYDASFEIRGKDQTPTEYPTVPGATAQTRDLNYKGSVILHLQANSAVYCHDDGSCEMQNPVKIDASIEFGNP